MGEAFICRRGGADVAAAEPVIASVVRKKYGSYSENSTYDGARKVAWSLDKTKTYILNLDFESATQSKKWVYYAAIKYNGSEFAATYVYSTRSSSDDESYLTVTYGKTGVSVESNYSNIIISNYSTAMLEITFE